jgi:hypothetical protein
MPYHYKVYPNYARKQAEIEQGRAAPEDLKAGETIIIYHKFSDVDVSPPDVDMRL